MTGFSYLNFDMQIQRAPEGGYRVHVEAPSGESIRAPFTMPFSDVELENFMLKAGPTRRGVRRADTAEMDTAKRFGEKLYAALFSADVRSALQSSLDQARRNGESGRGRVGVRVRLRLSEVPELSGVPWEYIYNPGLNRFLALSTETPLVRYLDMPERIRPLNVVAPLRVLVMITAPSDYPRLDVRQEWNNLNTAVAPLLEAGLLQLDLLETPTLTGLQRQLRRGDYHVFHFIGHGAFDRKAEDGLLLFEDDEGRGRPVSGQDLALLLHDHSPLRLAVLNACEGALSAADDPFAGVAQSLVQGGLPAVVAMQFEITDRAAIVFAHEFYRALSDGYPVDAAITEARKVLLTESRGAGLEWGTPVLYMRSPDGRIFDVQAPPQPVAQARPAVPEPAPQHTREPEPTPVVAAAVPVEAPAVPEGPTARPATEEAPTAATRTAEREVETRPAAAETARRKPNARVLGAVLVLAVLLVGGGVGAGLILAGGGNQTAPPAVTPTAQAGQVSANAEANYNSGVAAINDGDYDKAISELSEAIAGSPDYAEAYFYRAIAYRSNMMYNEAIADFTRTLELEPDSVYPYYERGLAYTYAGIATRAIEDFTRAIELQPNMIDAYYQRAGRYFDIGRYDDAITDFDKVIELNPGYGDSYFDRGRAYSSKADYEAAIEDFTLAINLDPNSAYYYYARGEAYRLLGDTESAIEDYRSVLEYADDDDSLREDAAQRLKVLGAEP
ncbi:MAG TPA: tetratricopeptide repeat protein [Chloroflexia bacterium]|nr:tetratricopeptide repeat protein [Chloroflexia bacterium]